MLNASEEECKPPCFKFRGKIYNKEIQQCECIVYQKQSKMNFMLNIMRYDFLAFTQSAI